MPSTVVLLLSRDRDIPSRTFQVKSVSTIASARGPPEPVHCNRGQAGHEPPPLHSITSSARPTIGVCGQYPPAELSASFRTDASQQALGARTGDAPGMARRDYTGSAQNIRLGFTSS